jgi:hypothetical protein
MAHKNQREAADKAYTYALESDSHRPQNLDMASRARSVSLMWAEVAQAYQGIEEPTEGPSERLTGYLDRWLGTPEPAECGWDSEETTTDCAWDPNCAIHGKDNPYHPVGIPFNSPDPNALDPEEVCCGGDCEGVAAPFDSEEYAETVREAKRKVDGALETLKSENEDTKSDETGDQKIKGLSYYSNKITWVARQGRWVRDVDDTRSYSVEPLKVYQNDAGHIIVIYRTTSGMSYEVDAAWFVNAFKFQVIV